MITHRTIGSINADVHGHGLPHPDPSVGELVRLIEPALTALSAKYFAANVTPTASQVFTDGVAWMAAQTSQTPASGTTPPPL